MASHECGLTELELELGSRVFARGRRVAGGEGPEGAPGVVRRCWPDPVREALALDEASGAAVERIVELEGVKARVEAQLLDTYGWLHTVLGQQYDGIVSRTGSGGRRLPIGLDQVVAKEICAATGLGEGEVSRRLALAIRPRRHRVVRERMACGLLGLGRALALSEASACLDDDAAVAALEEKVLAPPRLPGEPAAPADPGEPGEPAEPAGPGSSGAAAPVPVSAPTFRQRLRRALLAADPDGANRRRAAAVRDRAAYGRVTEEGTGVLTVTGTVERVVAALDRADAAARSARAGGDPRTLEQLRSDFVLDAVLTWWPDHTHANHGTHGNRQSRPADVTPGVTDDVTHGVTGNVTEGVTVVARDGWAGLGRPVPAKVWIVVPFEVAAGTSDAPCEVPGHGWVTAAHARQIITAPGSVWQHLPVQIDTGQVLGLASSGYRPGPRLAAHIRARDGVCRGPGCTVPADRCDLDHELPWPAGATEAGNLYAKSRRCHNTKTAGLWTSTPRPDGALAWTTLAGREYVTYPKNWRESIHDEPAQPETSIEDEPPPF